MKPKYNYNTFLENMDKKFKHNLISSSDESNKNIHYSKDKEEQIIKEILDAIEKKTNDKKNLPVPTIHNCGIYTNAYVSTLSSCYDKIPFTLDEVIRESIKEKQHTDKKKKKTIPKAPIIVKKKVKIRATINSITDLIK